MSSFELDPDEMREARKRLGDHLTLLTHYRNLAHELAQPLHDGNNPVAKQMRKAYLDRADTEGGVQAVLDDYIAELTDIRAEAAKKKAQQQRRFARTKRFAEKAAFHGIRWDYYSHRLLFTMIMSAQPRDMQEKADSWKSLSEAIRQTTDDVDRTMRRLLRTWRGGASETAFTSTESLAQWAWQASETAKRIGVGLDRYTEAVMAAQHRMPPPVSGNSFSGYHSGGVTTPNSAMMIAELIADQKAKDEETKAAKAEAVRVMQQYGQESQQVYGTMPAFYDAPNQPPGPPSVIPGPSPRPDPVLGVSSDVDGDGVSDTTAPESFTSTPNAGYPAMAVPGMPGAGLGGNAFLPPMGAGAQREEDGQHKNKYDDGVINSSTASDLWDPAGSPPRSPG